MDLLQLVYASRPFGFDPGTLNSILVHARDNNTRDGVTGALICRQDLYLQLLEGPENAVQGCFARISRDDRHCSIAPLVRRRAGRRLFGQWSMRDDEARSWMWTMPEVAAGAVERATEEEVMGIFSRLAEEPQRPAARACPMRA